MELAHFTVRQKSTDQFAIQDLLKSIANKGINVPFLCFSETIQNPTISFCVESSHLDDVLECQANLQIADDQNVKVVPSVGTCTVFPHKYSFTFLAKVLEAMETGNFPLYSFSTSISALALNTDFHLLDQFAEKLKTIFELPENHAPFRQEFQLKQLQK